MVSRRRSRLVAVALIVLTFLGSSGSWHPADDDVDFHAPLAHNHAAHHERLRTATAPGVSDHCAICHWLQSFRSDATRATRVHRLTTSVSERLAVTAPPVRAAVLPDLPPRAPPS